MHHHGAQILAGALIAAGVTFGAGPHGNTVEGSAVAMPLTEMHTAYVACRNLVVDDALDLAGEVAARLRQIRQEG